MDGNEVFVLCMQYGSDTRGTIMDAQVWEYVTRTGMAQQGKARHRLSMFYPLVRWNES